MNRIIISIVILGIILSAACSSEKAENEDWKPSLVNPIERHLKPIANFQGIYSLRNETFNALGHGYDMTGSPCDYIYLRGAVINMAEYTAYDPRLSISNTTYGYAYKVCGDTPEDYLEDLRRYFSGRYDYGENLFAREMSTRYGLSDLSNSENRYGLHESVFRTQMINLSVHPDFAPLTEDFLKSITTEDPDIIIKKFGTHVIQSVILGGKLSVHYIASTPYGDRLPIDQILDETVYNIFNAPEPPSVNNREYIHQPFIHYYMTGGNRLMQKQGIIDLSNVDSTIDISEWAKTIYRGDQDLIQIGAITPVYEFIADPDTREAVRQRTEEYIAESNERFIETLKYSKIK